MIWNWKQRTWRNYTLAIKQDYNGARERGRDYTVSTFNHRKRLLLKFLSATFNSLSLCSSNQEKKHPSNHCSSSLCTFQSLLLKTNATVKNKCQNKQPSHILFMQQSTHLLTNSIQSQYLIHNFFFKPKLHSHSKFQLVVSCNKVAKCPPCLCTVLSNRVNFVLYRCRFCIDER